MKPISRRALLKGMIGTGIATIGLPMLEAMLNGNGDAYANGAQLPLRFMTYFFGNGFILNRFVPLIAGPNYGLTEQLSPLINVAEYVSVLTGFDNNCEIQITHHEGLTAFSGYTMADQQGLSSKAGGPTIDQLIAAKTGLLTTVPSMQVGVSRHLSTIDGGTTLKCLSHKDTNQPLFPEWNPQEVWKGFFGAFTPPQDPSGPLRISALDAVKNQASRLKQRLGTYDRHRLDAHLESINTLEKKINALPPICNTPPQPSETNAEGATPEHFMATAKAMAELIAYAFACDITRVASYLLVGGAAATIFSDLGHNFPHHANTHNFPGSETKINDGILYQMECFGYLLEQLKSMPDGPNGNLLDNTIVYFSSDCAEGWTHAIKGQPVIVAGKGGGYLKPGLHVKGGGQNISNILLACLQAFIPTATEIGAGAPYSNTPCTEIVA